MTKREKVIKGLKCCAYAQVECFCPEDCPYHEYDTEDQDCIVVLHNNALDLLKAQEPVKPTRYQEGRWFKTWRCGACGGTLVFRSGTDKPKYCTDCGRAVKWDD